MFRPCSSHTENLDLNNSIKKNETLICNATTLRDSLSKDNEFLNSLIKSKTDEMKKLTDKLKQLKTTKKRNLEQIKIEDEKINKLEVQNRKYRRNQKYQDYCKKLKTCKPEESGLWYYDDHQCSICLEESIEFPAKLSCKHYLCRQTCLERILDSENVRCPICRRSIDYYKFYDDVDHQVKRFNRYDMQPINIDSDSDMFE